MGWTPYHYVHQNPINLIDPTGMSADGWRQEESTGNMTFDKSFTEKNTPEDFIFGDGFTDAVNGLSYNNDGTISELSFEEPIDGVSCVECHHKTSVPNGSISKP